MKKTLPSVVTIGLVLLAAGCDTTGLSPRERSGVSYSNYILALQSKAAPATNHLALPISLAVVQVGESAPPKSMLDKLGSESALVASTTALPLPADAERWYTVKDSAKEPATDYEKRMKTICGLAQSTGADYVFIFGGNLDSWRKNNFLSFFDITILGGFIFPGSKLNVEGKSAGSLIEAATGEPVLFVSTDAKESGISPDFLSDGKLDHLRAKVRDVLIANLTDELLKRIAAKSHAGPKAVAEPNH